MVPKSALPCRKVGAASVGGARDQAWRAGPARSGTYPLGPVGLGRGTFRQGEASPSPPPQGSVLLRPAGDLRREAGLAPPRLLLAQALLLPITRQPRLPLLRRLCLPPALVARSGSFPL